MNAWVDERMHEAETEIKGRANLKSKTVYLQSLI